MMGSIFKNQYREIFKNVQYKNDFHRFFFAVFKCLQRF